MLFRNELALPLTCRDFKEAGKQKTSNHLAEKCLKARETALQSMTQTSGIMPPHDQKSQTWEDPQITGKSVDNKTINNWKTI